MTETRYIRTTEVAKLIRKELKTSFPGYKFSVRSRSYAGGSSIDVSWTDGPTTNAVDAIIGHYHGATFDGMIDLKSHHDTVITTDDGAETVHFANDFLFTTRSLTPAFVAQVIEAYAQPVAPKEQCDLCGMPAVGYFANVKKMLCERDSYAAARTVPAPPAIPKEKVTT